MNHDLANPSESLDRKLVDVLRGRADEAERLNDLHPEQWAIILDQGWLKMFVPEQYGGLGWSLPKVVKLEESLSWADGSTAWVVTLCAGAGWFSGFLEPSLLMEILANDSVCFAGSGATTGIANRTSGGYAVNGQWKYASGSLHATIFTANCVLHNGGVPELNADGSPRVGTFLFLRDEVVLHPTWNTIGMIATGSHSFEVKDVVVGEGRRFTIDGRHATMKDPVYQYPFIQLAETTLSVNLAGMAASFMDLCASLFSRREQQALATKQAALDERLATARVMLDNYRLDFYGALESSWEMCERGVVIPREILEQVSKNSHALAVGALRLVDELYPYCGLTAANPRSDINRVWRNIHTASQHSLFTMS